MKATTAYNRIPRVVSYLSVILSTVAATAATLTAVSTTLSAQAVPGILFQSENDGLDLWLPKARRTDGEYSNGLRVSFSRGVAPLWGRLIRSDSGCSGKESEHRRCLITEFALSQQIYTPLNAENEPRPFDRPFAGWLHADITANVVSASRLRSIRLTTGFTGPPTLAGDLQEAFHRAAGVTNGDGWRYQLSFAPAGSLTYLEKLREVLVSSAGRSVLELIPSWSAQLGNSRTDFFGELIARAGFHLPHLWNPASRVREGSQNFGIWIYGGVRESLVAYDQTLDRSWSRRDSTFSVERIPWVNSYQFGIGIRRHSFMLTFGGVHEAREYATEFSPHSYGSVTFSVDQGARK